MGFPQSRPAGFEKSRSDGRRLNGPVKMGVGADGNTDAALSAADDPAPICWANPGGTPAVRVSITAAMACNCLPATFPRVLRVALRRSSNTRIPYKCIVPLRRLLRHVGCHS